jgi:hypothetical protein
MRRQLIFRSLLFLLTLAAVVLSVGGFVTLALGRLLEAMGDAVGAQVAGYVALGCGVLFVVDLICLVLVQAVRSLVELDDDSEPK